ncbi:MAG: hypothetical protein L0K46_07395, partial [Yaniella sp.]|nr:hypothetical protein [Yaniella sp.]
MAEKSTTRKLMTKLLQDTKRRITGARYQLADKRAQQQFTVPEPGEYPPTPITAAEDFSTPAAHGTASE